MRIIFKTPTGDTYQAELEDNKLTDIRRCDGSENPPSTSPGGSAPSEAENESKEQTKSGGGTGSDDTRSKEDKVFIEQLKAVLVNNRARKQLRHRQKGLLDTRALVKTQTDSTSVFRQNNRKDSQRNYSVVLLVDESGSMNGRKAELAQELTQSMAANLDQVGGVEVAVLGFSGNRIIEHKRFNNTGHSSLCCISEFAKDHYHCHIGEKIRDIRGSNCENADLIAMEYALGYLNNNHAPNSKQVFVMLSDGNPCDSPDDITIVSADLKGNYFTGKFTSGVPGRRSDISHMHKLLKLFPDVVSFGLGMREGGQQVPRHVVVEDLSQTKKVLLNFLRTAIT
jgi:hypothetical protein